MRLGKASRFALVFALSSCRAIAPHPPSLTPEPERLSELPPSTIDLPIRTNLSEPFARVNEEAPSVWDSWGAWTYEGGDKRYKYKAWRDRIDLALTGSALHTRTVVSYKAEGQAKPLLIWLSGSCGSDTEPRKLRPAFETTLSVLGNWRLDSRTKLSALDALNDCRITIFNIDVTDKVKRAVRGPLERVAALIDDNVTKVDLRPLANHAWERLQQPLRVADYGWLIIAPEDVRFGGLNGSGALLSTSMGLTARPRLVTGDQPQAGSAPLPDLVLSAPGSGFQIALEGLIDYGTINEQLARQLVGRRIARGRRHVEVTSVSAYGTGSATMTIEVGFRGSAKGRIYFTGAPLFDVLTQKLSVPTLDYDIATRNVLLKSADWLLHDDIRDFFRVQATWSAGETVTKAKSALQVALNQDLGDGVRLSGTVSAIEPLGLRAEVSSLRVRIAARGTALLSVER